MIFIVDIIVVRITYLSKVKMGQNIKTTESLPVYEISYRNGKVVLHLKSGHLKNNHVRELFRKYGEIMALVYDKGTIMDPNLCKDFSYILPRSRIDQGIDAASGLYQKNRWMFH